MLELTRSTRAALAVCLPVLLCLIAAALPASAAADLGDRTLRPGARGADVRELQSLLRDLRLARLVTGYFGPQTEAAVRRWERRADERADAVVPRSQVQRMKRTLRRLIANGGTTPAPGSPPGRIDNPPSIDPGRIPVAGYVFPIRGAHSFGTAISRFGAPRSGHSHQGHDVFAPIGTPVVAARGGRVSHRAFQSAAGNYVVIATDDGTDHVYMHLQAPGTVTPGQAVRTGQAIGRVGCTGRCSGAHLHFEVWTGRWYGGGRPMDPLPRLRAWDAGS